jgi:hypothetical protein
MLRNLSVFSDFWREYSTVANSPNRVSSPDFLRSAHWRFVINPTAFLMEANVSRYLRQKIVFDM